jgi:hypothetical protein
MKILEVKIEPVTRAFIPNLLNIASQQLGDSYIQESDFFPVNGISFYGSTANNDIVGFGACYMIDTELFLLKNPKIGNYSINEIATKERIGVLASVAEDDKFKGHGI